MKRTHAEEEEVVLPEVSALRHEIRVGLASAGELVALLDDLAKEVAEVSPYHNRSHLVKAFKEERLYVLTDSRLEDEATRALYTQRGVRIEPHFSTETWPVWTVPAFAVLERDKDDTIFLDMLWVRKDWRRLGYARALVDRLGCESACVIPEGEALAFWTRIGFRPTGERRENEIWMKREE